MMCAGMMRALKWALPAAAFLYLVVVLIYSDLHNVSAHLQAKTLAVAIAVAFLYGAALYLLAFSWTILLLRLTDRTVEVSAALKTYATTTLGKYLPGNIFHYVGRQVAAKQMGCGQAAAAQATAMEIAGHLIAAGLVILVLLPFAAGDVKWVRAMAIPFSGRWTLTLLVAVAVIAGLAVLGSRKLKWCSELDWRTLALAASLQLAFFVLYAALGVWLALNVLATSPEIIPVLALAYLLAWLVGFVTPGAPGGLGVREACLVLVLGPYGDPAAILAFAALSRAALLVGEGLFALSGFLIDPSQFPRLRSSGP